MRLQDLTNYKAVLFCLVIVLQLIRRNLHQLQMKNVTRTGTLFLFLFSSSLRQKQDDWITSEFVRQAPYCPWRNMAPAVWEAEHIYLFINTKNQMWIEFNRLGFFFFFLSYVTLKTMHLHWESPRQNLLYFWSKILFCTFFFFNQICSGSTKIETSRFDSCFSEVMLQVTGAVAMGRILASLKFSQSFQKQLAGLNAFYQYCWN